MTTRQALLCGGGSVVVLGVTAAAVWRWLCALADAIDYDRL